MPRPPSKEKKPDMIESITKKMEESNLFEVQKDIVDELRQEIKSLKGIMKAFKPLIKPPRATESKSVRPPSTRR